MLAFLTGALVMATGVAGLFFLQFWRKSGDQLFFFFAVAFWLLAANWTVLAFVDREEPQTTLYLIRLAAFGLIIVGIWRKNQQHARP